MTLTEALALVRGQKNAQDSRTYFLVCGFEPLHLVTFLQAHAAQARPREAAEVLTSTYGDVGEALAGAVRSNAEAAAVVIEWSDLDPRLGLRSAGGWALSAQPDILKTSQERLGRILSGLRELSGKMPVALVPPTLPFLFLGHTATWQSSRAELELQRSLASFLADAAGVAGISVLDSTTLARLSPEPCRLDPLMELRAGFPYTIAHASAVASQVVRVLCPPSRMKGLITDLDDTFWSGILGEVGPAGVSWSLSDHTQIHGLYQQMLAHLSEMGVLLAIATKNEPALVEEALRRDGLLAPPASFFPVISGWGPKSRSVAEILRTWNISPEAVAFIDDSPMELAEVQAAFPAMTCLQFSAKHPQKTLELFSELRDRFGKPAVQLEDSLRQASIRANAALELAGPNASTAEFVRGLQGVLSFDCRKDPSNTRLLELVNKTNQFNLNGVRLGDGEWRNHLRDENTVVMGVAYEDKFGPLGTIGVLAGRCVGDRFEVTSWVLSCRAFSRRIEHHMLDHLFKQHHVASVRLQFRGTDRNQPLQQHLASLGLDPQSSVELVLTRNDFQKQVEELPHTVRPHQQ